MSGEGRKLRIRSVLGVLSLATVAFLAFSFIAGPSAVPAHATSQVTLTASYSVIGGGSSGTQDLLQYVSGGATVVVPLTSTPTGYLVDSGTQWSALTVLNGSSSKERWTTSQDVSGVITTPLTISFSYYHQYLVTFNFNITKGGSGYSPPSVSYDEMGSGTSSPAGASPVWVDASSPYSYSGELPGTSTNERWILPSGGSGTISAPTSITSTYWHQYLVATSYSVVGGGPPAAPVIDSMAFGSNTGITLSPSTQNVWFDAGASYSWTSVITPVSVTNQKWVGTVLVPAQTGTALSMDNNGTVTGPIPVTPVYYQQFLVNVTFTFNGGSTTGLTLPPFNYQQFGSKASTSANEAVWVDGGSTYTLPADICCISTNSSERWELNNSTTGTITQATKISPVYFHQYLEGFAFSIVGLQAPPSSTQPNLSYMFAGSVQQLTLTTSEQMFWADAQTTYSTTSILASSGSTERWFAPAATGTIIGPAPNNIVDVAYDQQYLLTIVGATLPTQWVSAGTNTTLNTPGVWGRSQGTGYRVTSYTIDSKSPVTLSQPLSTLTLYISMEGPHTITFKSVTQFQVSLDAGASGGLSSITPPTIPGDNYWYDTGSPVQIALNGAWGRAGGTGHRLTSISATGQPTLHVNTTGTIQAYSNPLIQTPISITTTSATQYEVVLNPAAAGAFASVSPPSTFQGDTFWYDAGSPAVSVVLNGIYSRSAGTGDRTASWQLDGGPVTKIAQTNQLTIRTGAMTAPQLINTTSVVQYQVTLDKATTSALSTITSPSIPLDSGWYDSGTPVGVVLNSVWSRASGTGDRLASYSISGGAPVAVGSSGLVNALNLAQITSPESISGDVVTQYQLTLDSGGIASLSSITPPAIAGDKYWYDSGTPVSVVLNGVWGRTASAGSRLVSYTVSLKTTTVFSTSTVQALSLSGISAPEAITTKTGPQYHLSSNPVPWISVTNSTIPGDLPGWYDSGVAVKAVFDSTWATNSTGSRQSATSYTIDGGAKTTLTRPGNSTFLISLSMTGAHTIAITSVTQYLLSTSGPQQVSAIPPSPTQDSYFDSGSKETFTVPRQWNATSGQGTIETLSSYSINGATPVPVQASASSSTFTTPSVTFTGPVTLAFTANTQYLVNFQFFDSVGRNAVTPSVVDLTIGNSTTEIQGSSAWFPNGTAFSVSSVVWEGVGVGPAGSPSFVVKGAPLNITLETRVYSASLKVVDLFGLPVAGAHVAMSLANGTTINGVTKSNGIFSVAMIPLGTYSAKVTSLGSTAHIDGDAASGATIPVGRVALSIISLFVMVAAVAGAGSASILVLMRMRRDMSKSLS